MAAAACITILVQHRIAARLAVVTDSARQISGGDLNFRIKIRDSDGLGILATEFNKMAATLGARDRLLERRLQEINAARRALGKLNEDLEQRVQCHGARECN